MNAVGCPSRGIAPQWFTTRIFSESSEIARTFSGRSTPLKSLRWHIKAHSSWRWWNPMMGLMHVDACWCWVRCKFCLIFLHGILTQHTFIQSPNKGSPRVGNRWMTSFHRSQHRDFHGFGLNFEVWSDFCFWKHCLAGWSTPKVLFNSYFC